MKGMSYWKISLPVELHWTRALPGAMQAQPVTFVDTIVVFVLGFKNK